MTDSNGRTQIKVAKITAFQAIVVAFITALGSGIGFYAGKKPVSNEQRWLVVQGIDGPQGEPIRLVVSVNNIIYSYPADVPYTSIGRNMPEQKLPLPVDTDTYTISFEAQFQSVNEDGFQQARSRSRPAFAAKNLPSHRQQYALHGVREGVKGSDVALTIFYTFN